MKDRTIKATAGVAALIGTGVLFAIIYITFELIKNS